MLDDRTANACFKDVADLAAQLENYPLAIERYESVAQASLKSPLTRYSVKDYFLKAGLCHLCTGVRPDLCLPSLRASVLTVPESATHRTSSPPRGQ